MGHNPGEHTWREIMSQPEAWAQTIADLEVAMPQLRAVLTPSAYDQLIIVGCGSPYYLAHHAAALIRPRRGIAVTAAPASALWLDADALLAPGARTLVLALSRSGETTETVEALRVARAAGATTLGITSYPDRPIATVSDMTLVLAAGQEQSVAQTRAFTTLQLAVMACAALWNGAPPELRHWYPLCAVARHVLASSTVAMERLGADTTITRIALLGAGPRYGLASELALKLKEMSLSDTEPFHPLEYRHGPRALATPGALVIGLLDTVRHTRERAVLTDMAAQGAATLTIGERDTDIAFASGLPESLHGPLYLLPGQLLAYHRARARGQDPDQPAQLSAVVHLTP